MGELQTVSAAEKRGTIYTLSSLSTTSMKDVAQQAPNAFRWFQLYITKNRKFTEAMIREAERLGYRAIAVTVDAPYLGKAVPFEKIISKVIFFTLRNQRRRRTKQILPSSSS